MGGLPLALIPSRNERGCLRPLLALDWATSDLPLSQWQEPDLPHSEEAQVAFLLGLEEPPGEGWSQGWKNWSS